MHTNPLLEETWHTKDQLAAEAGYDVDRFFATLRQWTAEHGHSGILVRSAADLRKLVEEDEHKRNLPPTPSLNEPAAPYGSKE